MSRILQWLHDRRSHLKRIQMTTGNVYKFDKNKTYLIAFDDMYITKEECQALSKILYNKGITRMTCIVGQADPAKSIVVMENDR